MTKRRTQAERTEASDKAMFKAAISLIAEQGPDKMTLAQVGKKAGFTGGLVSYRFGSKSGLLQATSERILELWESRVLSRETILQNEPIESFRLIAKAYLDNVKKRSDLMVALHRLMHDSYGTCEDLLPYFQEYDNRVRDNLIQLINHGQKQKAIKKKLDAPAFAATFIGMLRGVSQQYFINPSEFDLKKAEAMIVQICEDTLSP